MSFQDFLKYTDILLNGDKQEKAMLSFRLIDDENKGKIIYSDIEKMIKGVTILWNILTDSQIIPNKEYIDYIFKFFDKKNKNEVYFDE